MSGMMQCNLCGGYHFKGGCSYDTVPDVPPDAVSGAATPAQGVSGAKCTVVAEASRLVPGAKCDLPRGHKGAHVSSDDGYMWAALNELPPEPAATPEAQIPECVQAPGSRADRLFRYLINPCDHLLDKSHYGDLVMFSEAAAAIRVLEGKLEATRTESAALRVERDQAWNEAMLKAIKKMIYWNPATDQEPDDALRELLRPCTPETHIWNSGECMVCDVVKENRLTFVRPIPAEPGDGK